MTTYTDLEYLGLPKWKKFLYKLLCFFVAIPRFFVNLGKTIGRFFKNLGLKIKNECVDIYQTFKCGDWKTRLSFIIMGFGSIARGQIFRGLLFLLFEAVFILYMVLAGGYWLSKFPTLGTVETTFDKEWGTYVEGDNSFKILLYGIITIIFIIALIYTWRVNVKQNKVAQQILDSGKKLKSGKEDLHSLIDDQFHKSLLALPTLGMCVFTVLPIIFMIMVAFTNYGPGHDPAAKHLFTWVGLDNWNMLFTWSTGGRSFAATFGEILTWTLIWAFFATFTNYFLGMFVAMMINKKGIKLKKLWRSILVLTIAIPQFISLLYISKLFGENGIINGYLMKWGWIKEAIPFWTDPTLARIMVILINIWIGIPYLMLMISGVLMNIPQDLYESSKIDGANTFQQFFKITLPYMLFITGPYLLTSFTANINNFNVIYLLTAGGPKNSDWNVTLNGVTVEAGSTDLLITWIYNITANNTQPMYMLAAVIAILIFLVISIISLIVYRLLPSVKNEEDFS